MHVAILPFTLIPLPTCEAVSLSQWLLEVIGLSRRLPESNGFHVAFGEAKQKNTPFLSVVARHKSYFPLLSAKSLYGVVLEMTRP